MKTVSDSDSSDALNNSQENTAEVETVSECLSESVADPEMDLKPLKDGSCAIQKNTYRLTNNLPAEDFNRRVRSDKPLNWEGERANDRLETDLDIIATVAATAESILNKKTGRTINNSEDIERDNVTHDGNEVEGGNDGLSNRFTRARSKPSNGHTPSPWRKTLTR